MYTQERLIQVFPRYFNKDNAASYARNPEKIANRVYANRMGNGNEQSGDGFKFRGRGYIQMTGKFNYEQFAKFIKDDVVKDPSLICIKYPLLSAAYFFEKSGLWNV
jgi:putative chitinase